MEFNEQQRQAIAHREGPMLVLAGPGSGKTSVITERAAQLIEAGVRPSGLLVITFTRAAANEMRERFQRRMPDAGVTFGTFHAVFFTILKHTYHLDRACVVSEEQRIGLMREILSRCSLEYTDEYEFIRKLLGEISLIKNSRIAVENFYSNCCGEAVFRDICAAYQRALAGRRLMDFDDMQVYTRELFSQRADILSAWQEKYPYILIDEFQDINQIQYEIIRMMAKPRNNLFVVGDDDQSIYRFRGARPEILLGFPDDYPDAEKVTLTVNYRSAPAIVAASGRLIAHNEHRFPKELRSSSKREAALDFQCFEDQRQENAYVVCEIERALENGVKPREIAVLCRTNTQPRLLMEQFMDQNIPFCTREQVPDLYSHWIARDLFAYLRLAGGGRARSDVLSVMNRPKRYIGRDSLPEPEVAFDEWLGYYEEKPWIAGRIERLWHDLTLMRTMSPYAAINYIRRGVGYDDYLIQYAKERNADREELLEVAEELLASAKGYPSVEAWLAHIEEYQRKQKELLGQKKNSPEAVSIATLHGAKGLEYEMVFLIDVNEGVMPYRKAVLDADLEEERRLFYVGMTRAKSVLHLCAVRTLNNQSAALSRFLGEAGT